MKKILALTPTLLILTIAVGQDAQYSQFYSNPLYLNPAFAGTANNTRVAVNHRILWPNLPQVFSSYSASIDYHHDAYNSGFGFLINTEAAGTVDLQTNSGAFIYSYQLAITKEFVIRPAIKIGHVIRGFDQSKLILGDQLDFGGGITSQDPGLRAFKLKNYWDIGTGILAFTSKYWFGLGVDHLNRANVSLLEGDDQLQIRYSAHAGGRFILMSKIPTGTIPATIAPSVLYKRQGNFQQLDIGASIHMQPLILGAYYRGIPIISDGFDNINQDAIIVQAGLEYSGLEIGYSFDIQLSQLDIVSGGGAHEFSLQYNFHLPWRNRHKPKKKLHCPAFLHGLHN
ncbi:MAG: PorP/SprF family type IX secretion system membrane protein [Cyclobacteriaceae bacterium]